MRLARIASAPKLKPSTDQQLYDEAHRKLRALEVVSALSLFKEYIERMKVKHGLESPLYDFKGLIQTICNFALRMQEQSGKSELPILILQWAEDVTKNTPVIKDVQQFLSAAYRKAGKMSLEAVSSPKFTTPRKIQLTTPLSKVKSETTFYFRGNLQQQVKNLQEKTEEQQLFQTQPSKKKFVIKKQKKEEQVPPPPPPVPQEQNKQQEDQNFEWSSSDEEKPKQEPPKISTFEERRQSENRIKFLMIELGIKLEARIIEIKKTKDEIVYPVKAITKLQAIIRRRIEQRRHKIRMQEEKRKKLQERYEELVRKIQGWFRKIKIRRRMIEAAYKLLDLKRRTIYPKKQQKCAILIQRSIRKCLAMKNFTKAKENLIRKKMITFKISQVSDKIQNQLFLFSVNWIDSKIQFKLQVYAKKKCDRLLVKPLILEIEENLFFYTFARLEEYADSLKSEIEPNQTVLQVIQYCCKVSLVFVKPIPGKYQLTQDKLHIVKCLQQVQFEDLLYTDNEMNLQMYGFSDFKCSDTYTLDIEQHANIINNIKQLNQSLKLIVLVQSVFKQRKAINLMRSKVNRRRHIKNSFGINFQGGYAQVFINQKDEIFARVIYQRRWQITNKLKINSQITKQLGFPCRENFFEIYQIKDSQIVYTEEGQYWVLKEEELTKKKKHFSFAQIECCICVIQRCIRKHLTQKQIILQRTVKHFQKNKQKEFSVISLVKKVVLSGEDPVRAFFMNFSVETDQESNEKIISIDVRSLEHNYQNDYIHPYKQPLFYDIPIDELTLIGQRMMTIGKVQQLKGQLKFDVPNLMEVQGMIIDEQDVTVTKAEDKKEDTLQARRLWNQHMRKQWNRGIEIELDINQIDNDIQYRGLKKGNKFSACLCIRSQHTKWRKELQSKLMNETDVLSYDQESISQYVRLYQYKSEMGYGEENKEEGKNNLDFLQIRKDEEDQREQRMKEQEQLQKEQEARKKKEEADRLKLEMESLIKIFSEYCVISSYRVLVTIKLNKLTNLLGVTAKTENNVLLQCQINILDILGGEISIEYLKQHVDISVIKQLVIEEDQLLFLSDAKLQEQLLIEQLKWEKLKNRKPQLENVEGEIYNLDDVFINLNKSKSMYENLIDNKYQVFFIREKRYQDRSHEYIFNLSFRQLIFTVYFDDFPSEFKTHIIPAQQFECKYLMEVIKNRPPEDIAKLFQPTLDYIDSVIQITDDNTTNFLKIQPYLSKIFQEQFAIRLQRRIKIRTQFLYFQMYRKRVQQNIFLMHRYILLDSVYIKLMFYLTQYVMKIVCQQLNEVDGNGNYIDKKVKYIYYMDLLKQKFDQPQFEQYKMKWMENSGLHMPYYYEQTYKPLIDYILTRIRFDNGIEFGTEFIVDQLKAPQQKQRNETQFYNMIEAVVKLQVKYKTFKEREKYNLKQEYTDKSQMRQVGKLFNRTIKILDNVIYLVNIYKIQTIETQITVDLINYSNRKIKYRGIYILDPTQMLNIGQQKMADYILSLVYIENDLLQFKSEIYNELNQQTTDVIDLKSPNNLKLIIPEKQKIELINNQQLLESQFNPETIYNVVYSGESKCQLSNENQKNTVSVAVNLTDLKKLYPYLHSDDRIAMKTISESLISAIQINNQGQVMVNSQKINPSFIEIEKGEIQIQQSHIKRQITDQKVLAKKTTSFGKQKYLMKISLIERKVAKIVADSIDTTQEHYELLYQVLAMLLDKKNGQSIEWELSSEDAEQLTHQKNQKSIANEISRRTLVVQDKFIYLAIDRVDIQRHHYPTCILFLEKGIRPIQRQFRNRQRLINFRDYKATVKSWKDSTGVLPNNCYLYLDSLKSDQQFIVLSGEDKAKHLMLICWNLSDFSKRIIEIPKQQYQQLFMKNKGQIIKLLTSFVEYKDDELIFNPPQMSQILTKFDSFQYQMKQ